MKNFGMMVIILVSILAGDKSFGSIIGLYHYWPGNQVEVFLKDGKPFLRVTDPHYIDIPECESGYQVFREESSKPQAGENLHIVTSGSIKGTGFYLWLNREKCLAAEWDHHNKDQKMTTKKLVQEIDIYSSFVDLFANAKEVKESFEKGEIVFVLGGQAKSVMDTAESARFEKTFTYEDAKNGKILLKPEGETFNH